MSDLDAFLAAVEAVEREAKKVVAGRIREAEEQGTKVSRFVEQARAALDGEEPRPSPSEKRPTAQRRPRGRRKKTPTATTPAAVRERRDGIERFLNEAQGPVAARQIRLSLGLTDDSTKTGLRRLCEEERAERTGRGRATRYLAKEQVNASTETLDGRILSVIHDRASATLDELAQATRAPKEEVKQVCWTLIREGEVHMEKRDRRTVYVVRRSA
jgi:hypothetical protein